MQKTQAGKIHKLPVWDLLSDSRKVISVPENMIRNAVGDSIDLSCGSHGAVVSRLIALGDGIVKQLPDFNNLEHEYNVEIYHHIEVGKKVNEYHTNLDGCGYIIAKANTISTAIANADRVLEIIKEAVFEQSDEEQYK